MATLTWLSRSPAARLTQVLVNLLSNAIRFTAKSDTRIVTLAVEVSAKAPDRDAPLIPPEETEYYIDQQKPIYLFFSVEDTGPGMTKEESSRLFAKFMQCVYQSLKLFLQADLDGPIEHPPINLPDDLT